MLELCFKIISSIAGAVLVVLPDWNVKDQDRSFFGDMLALISASLYAVYSTLLKVRIPDESEISMPIFFGNYFV